MVIVSPTVGAGFEKVMSSDDIVRFGFTLDNALMAKAVEKGEGVGNRNV